MKVLIYYPASFISVFILTAIDDLINHGHTVYLLTTVARGELQTAAEELGAIVHVAESSNRMTSVFHASWQLVRFCRRHKIDVVFSHLQYLNLVAAWSRFFIKAIVFPTRHHADNVYLSANKNALLLDRLVNILSAKILVVSEACKTHMVCYEKVSAKKITVLPLYYNFNFYHPGHQKDLIRTNLLKNELKLISVGRMVENKNQLTLLKVVCRLIKEGRKISLNLVDTGPLEFSLKQFIEQEGLGTQVKFLGRKSAILSYIAAADLLVHPSISEASCQVTKEAGICQVPVITVREVGDFDEYIIDRENGFTLSKDHIEEELYEVLKYIYNHQNLLPEMGKKLEKSVKEKFDIASVRETYTTIVNGIFL